MSSVQRLFNLPYVIQKWEGFRQFTCVNSRPISIALFVHKSEMNQTEQYIQEAHFPVRVRLILYIVDVTSKPDCVIVRNSTYGGCFPRTVYPINRLRNLAIADVTTSHFVLFDMDVWPSCHSTVPSSHVADTYSILLRLPKRYYTTFIIGCLNSTSPTAPTLLSVSTARTAQGSRTTSCTMYLSHSFFILEVPTIQLEGPALFFPIHANNLHPISSAGTLRAGAQVEESSAV